MQALKTEGNRDSVDATTDAKAFLAAQKLPRAIILLVPAGKAVDAVINQLAPDLSPGDLLIDAGNSQFKDTDRRHQELAAKQLNFFGMGVSGGESGARYGPSMMPGGPKAAYDRVQPMLEAIAAKVNGEPCVAYIGAGSSGHYVKMVHNGIEYGIMQLLAEVYDLLHRGVGLTNPELADLFDRWHQGELNSFLMEITAKIFRKIDPKTGKHLVDVILDVARQKGTGKWTSQEAMDLQVPLLTIDAAVALRDMSAYDTERSQAPQAAPIAGDAVQRRPRACLEQFRNATYTAILLTYAQGFAMLRKAVANLQLRPGPGIDREDLARRLHHPRGPCWSASARPTRSSRNCRTCCCIRRSPRPCSKRQGDLRGRGEAARSISASPPRG